MTPSLGGIDREIAFESLQLQTDESESTAKITNHIGVTNGNTQEKSLTGRLRMTSARLDGHIILQQQFRQDCFRPATETARMTIWSQVRAISGQTVLQSLRQTDKLDLQLSSDAVDLNRQDSEPPELQGMSFLNQVYGWHIRTWRWTVEQFNNQNDQRVEVWGGPSFMVCDAIGVHHFVDLVVFRNISPGCSKDVSQILTPIRLPYFQRHLILWSNMTIYGVVFAIVTMKASQQQNRQGTAMTILQAFSLSASVGSPFKESRMPNILEQCQE